MRWEVPTELSDEETSIAKKLKRIGKFYVFLREIRSELFDDEFQAELEVAYKKPRGQEPLPAALLAMVILLQAYTQTGDAEAVLTTQMDRRWQLVLGTLGSKKAPFGQGSLYRFRQRMIAHDLDQKLVDRTVELAKKTGKFGWQQLKVALDSSPLIGAGRVEDSWNLIGRAMSHVVEAVSVVTDVDRDRIIQEADLCVLMGSSVKASLDIDWDDGKQRHQAFQHLLSEAEALRHWVEQYAAQESQGPPLSEALADLNRVVEQDTEPDPDGEGRRLRRGVARDRMPSLGDREMRHGRKSKRKLFTGYKRHILKLVGPDIIAGAVVLPANQAEKDAAELLIQDAERQGTVVELFIDRGYLASPVVPKLVEQGGLVHCKPWPARNRGLYTKEDFGIDLESNQVTCPADVVAQISPNGRVARFPAKTCSACSQRAQCTTSKRGRSISIHQQETLLIELRKAKKTPEGRTGLRQRMVVEHGLAKVTNIQGTRARYKGVRKNTFDVRRTAAVANLQALARIRADEMKMAA